MMRAASSVSLGGVAAKQMALSTKLNHKTFSIRISGALEMKPRKRAKALTQSSFRRQQIHLVEDADCLQHGHADNFQALGTELVDGVLRRVPENIVVAVVEVNEVRTGDALLHKWDVIVVHRHGPSEEMRLIANPGSGLVDDVLEPRRRVRIALNIQIGISNHIRQQECLDFLQGSVGLPFIFQMANAIQAVVEKRDFLVGLYRFFGVVPHQPDAVAVARFAAELIREFQQQRAGGTAIIRSYERCLPERVIRIVMAGNDNDAILRSGKLGDDVVDWKLAFRRVGSERVVLDLVAPEVSEEIVFDLLMIGAAKRPRTESHDLFHVLDSTSRIDRRRRTAVRWK